MAETLEEQQKRLLEDQQKRLEEVTRAVSERLEQLRSGLPPERVATIERDVRGLNETVEALRRFEVKAMTAATLIASFTVAAVALAGWTLSTVSGLDGTTKVLIERTGVIQEQIKTMREDVQRIRESTDATKIAVTKIEAIIDRQTTSPSKTSR